MRKFTIFQSLFCLRCVSKSKMQMGKKELAQRTKIQHKKYNVNTLRVNSVSEMEITRWNTLVNRRITLIIHFSPINIATCLHTCIHRHYTTARTQTPLDSRAHIHIHGGNDIDSLSCRTFTVIFFLYFFGIVSIVYLVLMVCLTQAF